MLRAYATISQLHYRMFRHPLYSLLAAPFLAALCLMEWRDASGLAYLFGAGAVMQGIIGVAMTAVWVRDRKRRVERDASGS